MDHSSESVSVCNVLFVDDEVEILNALQRQMTLLDGYQGFFLDNPLEVLPLLEKEKIHVIVADVVMPEQDGISLLQEIKTEYPEIVRILLTAYGDYNTSLRAINEAEVFGFITKPWEQDFLFGHLKMAKEMITEGLNDQIQKEVPFAVVASWDDDKGISEMYFTRSNDVLAHKFAQRVFFMSSALFGQKYRFQNNLFTLPLKESDVIVRGLLEQVEDKNFGIFLFLEDFTSDRRRELDKMITTIEQHLYEDFNNETLEGIVEQL